MVIALDNDSGGRVVIARYLTLGLSGSEIVVLQSSVTYHTKNNVGLYENIYQGLFRADANVAVAIHKFRRA